MAPGGQTIIKTTDLNGSYSLFGGTSAATPHVSGLAALIRSVNSNLTWSQVKNIIEVTSDVVPGMTAAPGEDLEYGWGRINAYEAVKEAIPTKITQNITSPPNTVTWTSHMLIPNPNDPPTTHELSVDGVTLTIDPGAVVVIEQAVRLTAINGGKIILNAGAKIILEPAAEIIAGSGGEVQDNGATIIFQGAAACLATNGGILKFASGFTRTVDNGGFIAAFYPSVGTVEIADNTTLVFQDSAQFIVQEGMTVKLGTGVDIVVNAGAVAKFQGTAANPITFTSLDGIPNRSDWGTIFLYSDSNSVEYTTIEGSDWGVKIYDPIYLAGNVVIFRC